MDHGLVELPLFDEDSSQVYVGWPKSWIQFQSLPVMGDGVGIISLSIRDITQAVVGLRPEPEIDVLLVWTHFQGLPILRRRARLVRLFQDSTEHEVCFDVFRIACQCVFPQGLIGSANKPVWRQLQAIRAANSTAEPMPNTQRRAGHDAPSRIAPQTSAM